MAGEIKEIKRGRGGKRLGAGRNPTAIEAANQRARFQQPEQAETYRGLETPLDYMLAVMRDPHADFRRRDDMAKAAAPYCHVKMIDTKPAGKKEAAEAAALTAGEGSDWGDDLIVPPVRN
jgi:hypothetical protein